MVQFLLAQQVRLELEIETLFVEQMELFAVVFLVRVGCDDGQIIEFLQRVAILALQSVNAPCSVTQLQIVDFTLPFNSERGSDTKYNEHDNEGDIESKSMWFKPGYNSFFPPCCAC